MHVKSKSGLLVVVMFAIPSLAFAGRAEREFQREVGTKAGEIKTAIRNTCGCGPDITVNVASYPDVESRNANNVRYTLDALATLGTEFCTSADEKAIFCRHVRTVEIKFHASTCSATLTGTKLTLETSACYTDSAFIRSRALDSL